MDSRACGTGQNLITIPFFYIIEGPKEVHAGNKIKPPRGIETTETGEEKDSVVSGVS